MRVATVPPADVPQRTMQHHPMHSATSSSSCDTEYPAPPTSPNAAFNRSDPLLDIKLNHARQTVDFVKRNLSTHAPLDKAYMTVWQALDMIPDCTALTRALAAAEACRKAYPSQPWLHLVALLHPLGSLLALPAWGCQPSWIVGTESYPVGCRFSTKIPDHQFFSVNPDRRNRAYASDLGMYTGNCGLRAVYMSWTDCEYLHMVLALNETTLPHEGLFVVRHQRHGALLRGGYRHLFDSQDQAGMAWLERFVGAVSDAEEVVASASVVGYYDGLIKQYFPKCRDGMLRW